MVQITAIAGQSLQDIAYKYLGDFELWQQLADFNSLTAFDDIIGSQIQIPDISEFNATLNLESGFEDLSTTLQTINNWKSLQWI